MLKDTRKHQFFREKLLGWYVENQRCFPWKNTKDPYKIWLSEIILQQTRTDQGLPYYKRISEKYSDVYKLAAVDDDEFMKDWQGLGYYSRARNLLTTARWIAKENNGIFPKDYKGLLKLKGIGDYTASAIASFAYDLAHPVVDGNVIRVISRFLGVEAPVDMTATRKLINEMALLLLDKEKPAIYNQAIMDFGATQCTPKKTNCELCNMQYQCLAYEKGLVSMIPIKSKKIKRKHRYFNFIIIKSDTNNILIEKREASDIWQDLYQFPMVEREKAFININELEKLFHTKYNYQINQVALIHESNQILTHQTIHGKFYAVDPITFDLSQISKTKLKVCNDISSIALPKILSAFVIKFNI